MTMNVAQPAVALPATQAMPTQQLGYGMPAYGYGMPTMQMAQQPVYITSLSQLPPGAVAVSNPMLAQALGQSGVGAQVVQPSPIKSALKGAAIGALSGAAIGAIPFLPPGIIGGALIGAGVGAAIGLVKGLVAKKQQGDYHTMQQQEAQLRAQAQAQMVASTPDGARSATAPAEAVPAAKKGVVMGPEMRKKWAAKVKAERAAEAAAKK